MCVRINASFFLCNKPYTFSYFFKLPLKKSILISLLLVPVGTCVQQSHSFREKCSEMFLLTAVCAYLVGFAAALLCVLSTFCQSSEHVLVIKT